MTRNIFRSLINLFYPNICLSCKEKLTEDSIICEKCKKKLVFVERNVCLYCKKRQSDFGICQDCKDIFDFAGIISCFEFNKLMQILIHEFKYNEFKNLGRYLTEYLINKMAESKIPLNTDYIIPVPLHSVKKRERGFNQSDIIAKYISEAFDIPVAKELIKRKKYTKSQTTLTREEREKNVGNAFKITDRQLVKDKNFMIVDDVLTTGSTMNSIGKILLKCGANNLYAISIARA